MLRHSVESLRAVLSAFEQDQTRPYIRLSAFVRLLIGSRDADLEFFSQLGVPTKLIKIAKKDRGISQVMDVLIEGGPFRGSFLAFRPMVLGVLEDRLKYARESQKARRLLRNVVIYSKYIASWLTLAAVPHKVENKDGYFINENAIAFYKTQDLLRKAYGIAKEDILENQDKIKECQKKIKAQIKRLGCSVDYFRKKKKADFHIEYLAFYLWLALRVRHSMSSKDASQLLYKFFAGHKCTYDKPDKFNKGKIKKLRIWQGLTLPQNAVKPPWQNFERRMLKVFRKVESFLNRTA